MVAVVVKRGERKFKVVVVMKEGGSLEKRRREGWHGKYKGGRLFMVTTADFYPGMKGEKDGV